MRKWAVVLIGCAWVLWVNDGGWTPDSGHDTPEECWTAAGRSNAVSKVAKNLSVGEALDLVKCLPDTIDPRAKK